MNLAADDLIIGIFLVFTRVGTCLMLLPGFSTAQAPMQVRLFIAVAISLAVFPGVADRFDMAGVADDPTDILRRIAAEMVTGAAFALPIRFFVAALSFMGETVTQMIGLNAIPGVPMEEGQGAPALSALFNAAAVTLFFVLGLHANAILAVALTFEVVALGEFPVLADMVIRLRDGLSDAFLTVLRLAAPFVIFTISVNMLSGVINKLTPQIPVYFILTPFLIAGGLAMLYWIGDDMVALFMTALTAIVGL
ncbi:MAG: flagellar biosynthetic protein FliR [Alphaproteobacteria bacterium]|nr:MAG: flagellar biosynthetic protein FliR [Alphaproteobacteria bacterium]